jgi:hypothetical protein
MSSNTEMNTPLIAKKNQHYIVCLPTYGRPYITAVVSQSARLKTLQKIVGGWIQPVENTAFTIHPMFLENPKWSLAQRLLYDKNTKVYVNDEGGYACVPNMATILTDQQIAEEQGCRNLFGDVALVLTKNALEKVCDPMTLQVRPEDDPELEEEEEEEEEEEKKLEDMD